MWLQMLQVGTVDVNSQTQTAGDLFLMWRSPPAGEILQRAFLSSRRLISEQKRQGETIKVHERS